MRFLSKINWVDIAGFVIIIRVLYIAAKQGFINEFFKLSGVLSGLFLGFHYYTKIGGFLIKYLPIKSEKIIYTSVFTAIVLSTSLLFRWIKIIISLLFKIEPHYVIERWISLLTGIIRAVFIISICFFTVLLAKQRYLVKSEVKSLIFPFIKNISVNYYKSTFNIYKRLFPNTAEFNQEVVKYYETKGHIPKSRSKRH